MAKYTYAGNETRYYPALGLTAKPGDVVDLPEMPTDGRWEAAAAAKKAAQPEPTTP